eukprot:6733241-Prymnesium_polylepis.1
MCIRDSSKCASSLPVSTENRGGLWRAWSVASSALSNSRSHFTVTVPALRCPRTPPVAPRKTAVPTASTHPNSTSSFCRVGKNSA